MIFDEVALGLRLRGVEEQEIERESMKLWKSVVSMNSVIGLFLPCHLVRKKRVTIASILVLGAEIILLDEPTAGQDQKNYTEIMEFLEELHQKVHTICHDYAWYAIWCWIIQTELLSWWMGNLIRPILIQLVFE